ncbi:MAG TPA: PAS domain S-box protein [Candidatus Hydrogenedentes bacterium]|nr:PAS domain S-box protein [Candidatus Hydrogenedentota bacterium]HQH54459.1 PAS domain S-box protein [Candidatus Hydrogenedentota bacterium]
MKGWWGICAILTAGVFLFSASYYPNYYLDNELWGDFFEFFGTGLLVLGACIAARKLIPNSLTLYFLYVGALCLTFARFVDFSYEITAIETWPLVGGTGFGSELTPRITENAGYISILLAFLALLREATTLHVHLEQEHQRLKELHHRSVFLARVADMSAEAVFGCDRNGVIRTWNRGARALFEYAPEEAIGMPLGGLFTEGGERLSSISCELMDHGGPLLDVELPACTKSGRQFPAGASISMVSQDGGAILGFSIVVRDIEARKEAERKLTRSRDMLASALHNAEVGMFIVDRDLELLAINPRMEDIAGGEVTDFDTLRDACGRILAPQVQFVERITKDVLERGRPIEFRNLIMHRRDHTERICNAAVSPMFDDNGGVNGAVCIVVDVTEREALQARLIESQKMESLGRLAGGIAHDFNNILGGILGYASLMREIAQPESDFQRYAQAIEGAASRAAELTQQLLAFARGKKSEEQEVNLNAVIDETLSLLSLAIDPNIEVRFDAAPDLASAKVDLSQINQLLMNLLINARDAIRERGFIRVTTGNIDIDEAARARLSLDRPGPYVRVTIEDNGSGMPAEVVRHIFEPFFSTKTNTQGYGLGLSVVYGVVEAHGGGIYVDSQEGKGTRIDVYLPASDNVRKSIPEKSPPPRVHARKEHNRETVLIVDDEVFMQSLLRDLLEAEGYTVLSADTGEQSTEVFREHQENIALVIMDLLMPGMGGAAAIRLLREIVPNLPCIISSGYGTDTIEPAMQHDERIRFVPKPYKAMDMVAAVRDLLDTCAQVIS